MAATGFISCRALILAGALLAMLSPVPDTLAAANMPVGGALKPSDILKDQNMTGICKSKDIRNTMKSFENLRGCRVVEGFVQILLFDNVNESAFDNISFPELTEITDFLLLYRVNGLRSVGQLFPNLAVIRGQDKVLEYSFVIYEMSALQEIGLHSLLEISEGLIRIDKNPTLCFVNSIDWELIALDKRGDHFIKGGKAESECPLCPGDDETSHFKCPVSEKKHLNGRHLCWNKHHCQRVCPAKCLTSCNSRGECCGEKCLGGCKDNDPKACNLCRNFTMNHRDNCTEGCPENRYKFLGRRCITKEECINTKKPLKMNSKIQHDFPYKIHKQSCVLECPPDYTDDYVKHTCKACEGRCKKECQGTVIDSLFSAQQLRGCTHINGSLEIQIRGGKNIVNGLEENLSTIEEIDGYLKVVRSFSLVSLNFFKKLRVIRGRMLESQKYVFIVLDNQNLEDIWIWDNRSLRIENGRLFFHFNPLLCINKIVMLQQKANLSPFTNLEVASNSNGDKIACHVKDLIVNVAQKHSRAIVLQWQQFEMKDHRKLLGYVISSIEAPYRNITLYDGKDACGGDGWRQDDAPIHDDNNATYLLNKLKPYTQYAFYVKTYTVASELSSGAQSQIYYIRTLSDKPSNPTEVVAESPKTTEKNTTLLIRWKPPLHPNGNVTHYIVTGVRRIEILSEILKRRPNYCNTTNSDKEPPKIEPNIDLKQSNATCDCKDNANPAHKLKNASIASDQIQFEDNLYNFVYIKNVNYREKRVLGTSRRKRALDSFPNSTMDDYHKINESVSNETDSTGKYLAFSLRVDYKTHILVPNLKHYADYDIKIKACREEEEGALNDTCSQTTILSVRTEKKAGADRISVINLNKTLGYVTFTWDDPIEPNGYILSYQIEYQNLDMATPLQTCVTVVEFASNNRKFLLKDLSPGNYSMRIYARSQADTKEWSDYHHFYVDEPSSHPTVVIIVLSLITVVTLFGVAWYFLRPKPKEDKTLFATVNPEYVSRVYEPDEWEVLRDKIKLIKELGQGSFGMVYEGLAKDIKGKALTKCAIKTVNEHATNRERIEFLNEANVMKDIDTAHVVRLLGVVSQGHPTLVVMELMAHGDLKSYLRSHRHNFDCYDKSSRQPPTLKRILQMAIEIVDGMAYLSAKKLIHRDLAARNCMVAENLTVKIGDFGMARDVYETDYYRKGTKGLLPVRWMAPESLKDGLFSSSSDVWSYGVVLWEMATLASQPYQGLSNDQVLRYVIDGGIMERPENCPDKLYDLMMRCWRHKPSDRPSFLTLCTFLIDDASNSFCQVSFYHSTAGMEARNSPVSHSPAQDDPSTPLRRNKIDENFSMTSSDDSDHEGLEAESNFTSYPSMTKDVSSTANGYVSTRASNGTTT